MAVKLKFKFPTATLTQEADYILDASEEHAAEINPRLEDNHVATMRTLLGTVGGDTSVQKSKVADVADLTGAQNDALTNLNDLVSRAKDSAKRAFGGQDVKLRNEFQVGINSPNDLASILSRARIVCDSCVKDTNAPLLAKKGWIAGDTTALTTAIEALDTKDDTQEGSKVDKTEATNARNQAANDLYEGLLTIQNAANNQWPENGNGNTAFRTKFRIGLFPPKQERKKKDATPAPPAPPA
jgi:hypothetical protein